MREYYCPQSFMWVVTAVLISTQPCHAQRTTFHHMAVGVMSRSTFHQGHPRAFHLKVSFRLRCHFPLRAPSFLFGPQRPAKWGDASAKGWRRQEAALLYGWTSERRSLLLISAFQQFSERHRIQATNKMQNMSISSTQSTEPEGVDRAWITGCGPGFRANWSMCV